MNFFLKSFIVSAGEIVFQVVITTRNNFTVDIGPVKMSLKGAPV